MRCGLSHHDFRAASAARLCAAARSPTIDPRMSDAARHRVRLWLRSEAALGLSSVPAPVSLADAVVQESPHYEPHLHPAADHPEEPAPYQHEAPAPRRDESAS